MIRLFILLFMLSISMMAIAQKDSTIRKTNIPIKPITQQPIRLTSPQQQWLNTNYKKLAGLKKDSAATVIRKNFTSITEASLEYMINQASKLQKGDNRQQLALMKQMLEQLKQQKQALTGKIQEKENQLAKETDPAKKQAITNEILELKKKLNQVEDNIRRKKETIRQLEANS